MAKKSQKVKSCISRVSENTRRRNCVAELLLDMHLGMGDC